MRFDDMRDLESAIEDAYRHLNGRGFSEREVILDLTSGMVSCSVMGAILGLKAGRRAEYVSTTDLRVWVYDLELGETID